VIFMASLFFCLGFFTDSLVSAQNKQAREIGELELSKYVIKCGDSWYVKESNGPILHELRRNGVTKLIDHNLTESDRLNGFEYSGFLDFIYEGPGRIYSDRYRNQNGWSQWVETYINITIRIIKKSGSSYTCSMASKPFSIISCNDVPGRASEPKKAKPISGRDKFLERMRNAALLYDSRNSFLEKEKQRADLTSTLPKIEGHWEMAGNQIYFSPSKLVGNSREGELVFVLPDFTSVSSYINIYNAERGIKDEEDEGIILGTKRQIEYMKKYSGKIFHARYRIYGKLENKPEHQNAERILLNIDFTPPPQDPIGKSWLLIFWYFMEGGDHVFYVSKDGKFMENETGYPTGNIGPSLDKNFVIRYVDSRTAPEVKK